MFGRRKYNRLINLKKKMNTIYIVGTPIGNLQDITLRALETFKKADIILSETPKTTLKMLSHFEIKKSIFSFFQNPTSKQIEDILRWLKEGKDIAIVSEAGTPGVSDPGNKLISDLLKRNSNIKVVPIPGVSAITTAISISGINAQKFCFLGFVPKTKKNKFWKEVSGFDGAVLFFESTFRIKKTLLEIKEKVQNKETIIIFREMTKIFEEVIRTDFDRLEDDMSEMKDKGEFTILVI
jgi:16S rRNA (cytidine1402-2'-O)-methyltransferase